MHSFAWRPAGWFDRLDTLLTRLRRPAVEFLQSPYLNETSCVIVDVQMPGMTGVELQDVLNAQECSVPMIFITAFPEEHPVARYESRSALLSQQAVRCDRLDRGHRRPETV
jgi:CheY-like chemotaxis protein